MPTPAPSARLRLGRRRNRRQRRRRGPRRDPRRRRPATNAVADRVADAAAYAAPIAVADHHAGKPDGEPGLQPDAAPDAAAHAAAHAKPDAPADASADTCTLALADGAADAIANPSADASALSFAVASAHAEAVALADRDARKSDGVARLRSDAAADAHPDEQPDASSGLLLLHRRLRRLYGGVDDPGLLERERSVRDQLRCSMVRWILARTAAPDAVARGHAGIYRDRRPHLRRHHVRDSAGQRRRVRGRGRRSMWRRRVSCDRGDLPSAAPRRLDDAGVVVTYTIEVETAEPLQLSAR